MAATLLITYEDKDSTPGYTLVDRGTWLKFNDTYATLNVLAQSIVGEDYLLNPYGVIPVNPILHPSANYVAACRFAGFLTSPYGQALIESYTVNNEILFHPDFTECDTLTNCSTTAQEIAIWTDFQAEFAGLSV